MNVSNVGAPEEVFLPFWVVSCKVHVRLVQAQVGRNVLRYRRNPATQRTEAYWDTDWYWVQDNIRMDRVYSPAQYPDLQIYASHRYRRGLVNGIRTGQGLRDATAFQPNLMDRPHYDHPAYEAIQRRLDPYTMYPTTALRMVRSFIQTNEENAMEAFLCDKYNGDKTRLMDLEVTLSDVRVAPVYYPAFVFTIRYMGRSLRTFVNGHDLSVGGIRIYNWRRVALVSAAGMAGLMILNGGLGWGGASGTYWAGIVIPSLATSLFVMYYPLLSLHVRDWMRKREIASQAQDAKTWETSWTDDYDEADQRWQSYKQSHRATPSTARHDPQGYYAILGVPATASKSEIQSAFRGLAMKYHPDRYTEPEDKEKAKTKFQDISNAYSVLRDERKRRKYDETGQG
ncbi:DnaJ-domain-containing protein [Hesseltinella vesiculosa]|uniref:DnaJ-domain-containing protein n=1 Tax=Hesseltinella vesiculosa TaxID=101127 RepID=A0A1X2GXZ5_9FUNG|nr:DnaJ-domain-containing protein [Hesseltinella vesiculosa]